LWNRFARHAVSTSGLADVRRVARQVRVSPAPPWSAPQERFWIRPEVASRLEAAARALPGSFSLGFWEGFRPLGVQSSLWRIGLELVAAMYPTLSNAQLESVVETYIARPTPYAPHALGLAVDVALLDSSGRVLEDRAYLQVLSTALREAGLSDYEPEWWHWSYEAGDNELLQ
jgi:D-alanyl-D-alanine dipeptidase